MLDLDFNPYSSILLSKSLKIDKISNIEEIKDIITKNKEDEIVFYGRQNDYESIKDLANISHKAKYNFSIKELKDLILKLKDEDIKLELLKYINQIENIKTYDIVMIDFCENSNFLAEFLGFYKLDFSLTSKVKNFYISKEAQNIQIEYLQNGKIFKEEIEDEKNLNEVLLTLDEDKFITKLTLNKNLNDAANLIYFSLHLQNLNDETLLINKINNDNDYLFIVILDEKIIQNNYLFKTLKEKENRENIIFISEQESKYLNENDNNFNFLSKIDDENVLSVLKNLNYKKNISKEINDLLSYINEYYLQMQSQEKYLSYSILNNEKLLQNSKDEVELEKKDKIIDFLQKNINVIDDIKKQIDINKIEISKLISSQRNIILQAWVKQLDKDFDEEINFLFDKIKDEKINQEFIDELNKVNIKYITKLRQNLIKMLNETKDEVCNVSDKVFNDFENFLKFYTLENKERNDN